MPIPVSVGAGLPPQPGQSTPVVSDAFVLTYIAPDTTEVPLTSPEVGWHALDAISALHGVAPVDLTTDDDAAGGVIVRNTRALPRIITLPIRIDGPAGEHRLRLRFLGRLLKMAKNQSTGTLRIAHPDGTVRQIPVVYYGGFDPEAGNLGGWQYSTCILQLLCPDPYWADVDPIPFDREFDSGGTSDYQDPYPMESSSTALGDTLVYNVGDVEAWPRYVINGPATLITVTNTYTMPDPSGDPEDPPITVVRTFTIDPNATGIAHGDLLLGEQVTVSTRPMRVRGPDGTSVWTAALGYPDNADLWPLQPGLNTVTFTISGADDGSSIIGSYRPRWETP
jgi:hypothetical protein